MTMESTTKVTESTTSLILTSGASGRVNALLSLRAVKRLLMLVYTIMLFLLLPLTRVRRRTMMVVGESDENVCHRKSLSSVSSTVKRNRRVYNVNSDDNEDDCKTSVASKEIVVLEDFDVVTRRAISIKRVTQDDDDDCDTVREACLFGNSRGETLFTQSWTPASVKVKGLVVLLHGLNEHSGRYNDFAKQLNANGFKVFGMDWIGHGGSDGLHGYVYSLDAAVNDLKAFIEKVLAENPGLPCFCFGHSTGGAIVLKAVLDPKIETRIQGVVLTSPAVGVQPSHPIFGVLAPIFSFLLPKYQFSAANKNGLTVSRDPDALIAKYSDPLVYTGSIRVRTGAEILRISSFLQERMSKITIPFFVLHGTADAVTDPNGSRRLYEKAASTDKSIKLYDGLLHDLLFEPEREVIRNDIIEWLTSRIK
ncbi:uncharacterized protein LOC113282588 [Papaver somniferum]|uniref:uncharacterized protein LOC113282588 n=1 Tax=Papaver somniferum TaxID=3469 RepID=UPI000E6FDF9A|nr:uncharacterized protein LOC113282588 [Papaver somniferum]